MDSENINFNKSDSNSDKSIDISVVIPVYNEDACIGNTIRELYGVLKEMPESCEVIAVDDGSNDGTLVCLKDLVLEFPCIRVFTLNPNAGQSSAFGVGFSNALGRIIVTMDADGQNDPSDIPLLIEKLDSADLCCGYREDRQDSLTKRIGSKLANRIRNWILREDVIDTGCSLKAFKADIVRDITMWKGMHRFIPSLFKIKGAVICQVPVKHRVRTLGKSKYTNWGRLKETIWDLYAVRWMQKRNPQFRVEEI